jgi:hypothetical protein
MVAATFSLTLFLELTGAAFESSLMCAVHFLHHFLAP